MIYRNRSSVSAPAFLQHTHPRYIREMTRLINWYSGNPPSNTDFRLYGEPEVRDRLNELFEFKCAYCEGKSLAHAGYDVEHWRPKAKVNPRNGISLYGYWWLAIEWENLLPSCQACNRKRQDPITTGSRRSFGKECKFPLPAHQFHAINAAQVAAETPLLINPCLEDPSAYLVFSRRIGRKSQIESVVSGADGPSGKGQTSIDCYGLNRDSLVAERSEILTLLDGLLAEIEDDAIERWSAPGFKPTVADHYWLKRKFRRVIKLYCLRRRRFSLACATRYFEWRTKLMASLNAIAI